MKSKVNINNPQEVVEYVKNTILNYKRDYIYISIEFPEIAHGEYPVIMKVAEELRKIGFDAKYSKGFSDFRGESNPVTILTKNYYYITPSKIYNDPNIQLWAKRLHKEVKLPATFAPKSFLESIGLTEKDIVVEFYDNIDKPESPSVVIAQAYPVNEDHIQSLSISDTTRSLKAPSAPPFVSEINKEASDSSKHNKEAPSAPPLPLDHQSLNVPHIQPYPNPNEIKNIIDSFSRNPALQPKLKYLLNPNRLGENEQNKLSKFQLPLYTPAFSQYSQAFLGTEKVSALDAASLIQSYLNHNSFSKKDQEEVKKYIENILPATSKEQAFSNSIKTQEVKTQKESSPALKYHAGAFLGLTASKLCEVTNDYMFGQPKTNEKYIADYIGSVFSYTTNAFITHSSLFVANAVFPGQHNKNFAFIKTGVNILWTLANQIYSEGKETINSVSLIFNSFLLGNPDKVQEYAGSIGFTNSILYENECSELAYKIWDHFHFQEWI